MTYIIRSKLTCNTLPVVWSISIHKIRIPYLLYKTTSVLPDKISASSVKLRRKNRESLADAEKKRNRYSGGDFLLGSPARGHNFRGREATAQPQVPASSYGGQTQPEQSQDRMRKSGDWSYVSFPGRGCQLSRHY